MLKPKPYKLKNTIQNYEWGTKGKNAFIPKLLAIKAEKNKPYAELWMGAHPKASSKIIFDGKGIELAELIRKHPFEMLGRKTAKKFSNTLPFLFKVLSANEALSIQVHPNKRQAIALHKKDPSNYPDSNQKLEIAIALDSLTAFIGFSPKDKILRTIQLYPEILAYFNKEYRNTFSNRHSEFISESKIEMLKQVQHDKKFMKQVLATIIRRSISDIDGFGLMISNLHSRIQKKKNRSEIEKYFLKLHKKYNADIGLLILFFLNLVHLKKGEAIFTKPGVPHAYMKGNILECMSNSDNVIRAGLTPKYKDVETLLTVLTYDMERPQILKGKVKGSTTVYNTDAKEFELQLYNMKKKELIFEKQSGPKVLLVLEGEIKIEYFDNGETKSISTSKGESVFLPSSLTNFLIHPVKSSQLVIVTVPVK